jgi:aryl-alcohol dehydrogenase-like predicted oxidoreductase
MEQRRFGRTEHMSSAVIFGAAAVGQVSQDEADNFLRLLMDHGVNHIDVAPTYHDAELRVGPWMAEHRDAFFLGCKTMERTESGAWDEIHLSLERLQADHFDLYQLHAVTTLEELEECCGPGGALHAIAEAREMGLTQYIGITTHGMQAPAVGLAALGWFDFDSILFPVNFVLWANEEYRNKATELLEMAAVRDVGVMAIKTWAKRPWGDREHRYHTWYEPFDEPTMIERTLRFTLSQHITSAISAGDTRLLPMVLDAAEKFAPMDEADQAALIGEASQYQPIFD